MENNILSYFVAPVLTWYPTWRILKRSGLNPWWSFLLLIPAGLGVIIIIPMLAFTDWPLNNKRG